MRKRKQKWRRGQVIGEDRWTFPEAETKCAAGSVYTALDHPQGRVFLYADNGDKRTYQLEVSQSAARTNTLVIIPTGCGKTFVGAMLIFNFYRWFPEGRIVFVAPSKPLVRQQMLAVVTSTQIDRSDVMEFTGGVQTAGSTAPVGDKAHLLRDAAGGPARH